MLQDVNITVPQGTIFGLIGPNGAGKTTVFNLITGLLPPTGGSLTFNNESLVGIKPHQITRRGIARTFQNIRIFKEMTLLEKRGGRHAPPSGLRSCRIDPEPARFSRAGKTRAGTGA